MQEVAALEQVYGDVQESEGLLPMNELGIEFGYALYEAEITVEDVDPILAVENIRDYASVYVDGRLQGWITDNQKNIKLTVSTGTHHLQLTTVTNLIIKFSFYYTLILLIKYSFLR